MILRLASTTGILILQTLTVAAGCPPVVAFAASLWQNRTKGDAIALIIVALGTWMWLFAAALRHNAAVFERMHNGFLLPYAHCRFTKVDENLLLRDKGQVLADFQATPSNLGRHSLPHVYAVERDRPGTPFPSAFSTYSLVGGIPGYIFINAPIESLNGFQKFCLDHEIGHATDQQNSILLRDTFLVHYLLVLVPLTPLVSQAPHASLLLAVAFLAFWYCHSQVRAGDDPRAEIIADNFGLKHINTLKELDLVARLYPKFLLRVTSKGSALQMQLNDFKRNVEESRTFLEARTHHDRSALARFNSDTRKFISRSWIARPLTFVAMIWMGLNFRSATIVDIATIAVVLLVIPLLPLVINMHNALNRDVDVEVFLRRNRSDRVTA